MSEIDPETENREMVKDALRQWGKWAKRDDLGRLWFLNKSSHMVDHTRYHEGENELEKLVDRLVAALGKSYPVARDALYLYYVHEEADTGHLNWKEVADKLQCSERKVREAVTAAIWFMVSPIHEFYEGDQSRAA